ncbi:hypothetical protein SKPI104516_09520 [Skermania piniformis]
MAGSAEALRNRMGDWRRSPWTPVVVVGFVTSLAITILITLTPAGVRDRMQHDLTVRADRALYQAGVPEAQVRFTGRDATLYDIPTGQDLVAVDALRQMYGVRGVRVYRAEAEPVDGIPGPFGVTVQGEEVDLRGSVVDQATADRVLEAAGKQASGRKILDNLSVGTADGGGWPPMSAVDVVGAAVAPGVGVVLDGLTVTLTGAVPTELEKVAADQRVRVAAPGSVVRNELVMQQPGAVVAPGAVQQQVDAAIAVRSVAFEVHTATLTPAAGATVGQIAELLKTAPQTRLELAGTGDRTLTIRDLLVEAGIPTERIEQAPGGDPVRFTVR